MFANVHRRHVTLALLVFTALAGAALASAAGGGLGGGFRTIGRDAADTRDQPFEHIVRPSNVKRLAPKWTTAGDVSATPVVAHRAVYFPDWGGML
jgi:polyvinyl alcohol dehydrogenase (cytochrome)